MTFKSINHWLYQTLLILLLIFNSQKDICFLSLLWRLRSVGNNNGTYTSMCFFKMIGRDIKSLHSLYPRCLLISCRWYDGLKYQFLSSLTSLSRIQYVPDIFRCWCWYYKSQLTFSLSFAESELTIVWYPISSHVQPWTEYNGAQIYQSHCSGARFLNYHYSYCSYKTQRQFHTILQAITLSAQAILDL